MSEPVRIAAQQVSHTFNPGTPHAREVLRDVNLRLAEKRVGIIGHNGSGKSTFIRMIDALLLPSQGEIFVDGLSIRKDPSKIRSRTGFLFTAPDAQILMPTVAEDAGFGLRRLKLPKAEVAARVAEHLELFGLSDYADHPAHLMSAGQKQLLALASVLITEPKLIIADEPTTLLDLRNARFIGSLLDGLEQTVILATHHLRLLESFDRVICFDQGRVAADGAPGEVVAFYRKLMDRPVGVEEL